MSPAERRSPSKTRTTPIDRSNLEANSTTDIGSQLAAMMAWCSGCRCGGGGAPGMVAMTNATRSNSVIDGATRPCVMAYGRTTGPASRSSQSCGAFNGSAGIGRCHGGPLGCGHELTDPGHQHRHLVRDQAEVGVTGGEHGETGALTGG